MKTDKLKNLFMLISGISSKGQSKTKKDDYTYFYRDGKRIADQTKSGPHKNQISLLNFNIWL